jgi:hypothetical protein
MEAKMNLTDTFASINDTLRALDLGRGARLWIVNHDMTHGYQVVAEVKKGWGINEVQSDSDNTSALNIEVPESLVATAARLRTAAGFGLRTADLVATKSLLANQALVIKVDDRKAPLGETRMWSFSVSYTNEKVTIA